MLPEDFQQWRAQTPNAEEPRFGPRWMRVIAFLLDAIVIALMVSVLFTMFNMDFETITTEDGQSAPPLLQGLLAFLISWGYFSAFDASVWRGTPGKRVLGLSVVRHHRLADREDDGRPLYADAGRLSLGRSTVRTGCFFFLTLFFAIDILWSLGHPRRCCLHDALTRSNVLLRDPFADD